MTARATPGTTRLAAPALALALACVCAATGAGAQTFGYDDRRSFESPQNFAFELRIGPYIPNVDSEFGGRATPYRDIFGPDPRVLVGGEFDWQIVRIGPVLSLGVGLSAAYASVTANAPFSTATIDPNPNTWGMRSAEVTALNVIPVNVLAVARFDGLARNVRWVPLVPYAKAGLASGFWWVTHGRGTARTSDGRDAVGYSLGYHLAVGLQLMIDALDPTSPSLQRQWDSTGGVNHSYLFFELSMSDTGGARQLNIGATTWTAGIMLEF